MEHMCVFVKFFLHFTNLYPSTPQAPVNMELNMCLKHCLDSESCLSVFYDEGKMECLLIEVFLPKSDSGLVEKQGAFYYGMDKDPLQVECEVSTGYTLEESGVCLRHGSGTWSTARSSCESDGASLVKIASREKDAALKLVLSGSTWTGGNDITTEGVNVWTDGTSIQGFTDWHINEPDGGTKQNCIANAFAASQ